MQSAKRQALSWPSHGHAVRASEPWVASFEGKGQSACGPCSWGRPMNFTSAQPRRSVSRSLILTGNAVPVKLAGRVIGAGPDVPK